MADPPSVLSLCSGGLGLDLGYECATPGACVVCAVEREPFCIAYLAALMEAGDVEPFPVWDDIRSFDGGPWRGVVDCVAAGYPCQPFSVAGKRRGTDDERHLWPEVARIIGEWDHASVSLADRCPTWSEMEHVRNVCFHDHEIAVQYGVPAGRHINHHPYCLHWWRPQLGHGYDLPPKEFV